MHEYKTQQELYQNLIPALNVKLRLLKKNNYNNITRKDIWNYLKNTKWTNSVNLTISEMVNDIIHADDKEIDIYRKRNLRESN